MTNGPAPAAGVFRRHAWTGLQPGAPTLFAVLAGWPHPTPSTASRADPSSGRSIAGHRHHPHS
ncbi:MAG TPA: hypothetical protein VKV33_12640 [Streptosporangiaceae bacterium]|nr:hypothetical protein [Streptosporangiaceae bacterium]